MSIAAKSAGRPAIRASIEACSRTSSTRVRRRSVVSSAAIASAIVFLSMNAQLVPIFLAVDVLAVVVAFLASFKAGRMVERVQVSAAEVKVTYEAGGQVRVVWESPTAFTRVTTERDED